MIIPSLHRNPVALSAEEHGRLRVKVPVTDWQFAASSNALFVAGTEIGHAAREFPIVFVEAGQDEQGKTDIAPVAVCGLVKDQNLFVASGRWRGRYVPTVLRLYPFCIGRLDAERLALGVDLSAPVLGTAEGDPLFTPDGQDITPKVRSAFEQLQAYDAEIQSTRQLCRQLRDLGLLRAARFDATIDGGEKLGVDGFFTVDDQKLGALPDADVVALHRNGALGLVHAHYVSLGHMNQLLEWHVERQSAAPVASA